MIVYDNLCTPCIRKDRWNQLKSFCYKHKLNLERVDLSKDRDLREPAKSFNAQIPFVEHKGKTVSLLNGNFEELL